MDGLAQVHGWTFRSAWFRFRRYMDGLKKPDFDPKRHARQPPHDHLGKKCFRRRAERSCGQVAFSSLDKSNIPDILAKV